jgi:DNA-binding transcriptional ArsR family regulator
MERAFLAEQLAAGRSLEQIGAMVGKHPSTIGYWLKKHGLRAAHSDRFSPKGTIDPDEFAALVDLGLTRAELQRKLDISGATVSYWLRKLGLTTRRGALIRRNDAARSAGVRIVQRHCRAHGEGRFVLTSRGTYGCMRCRTDAVAARRRRVKRILVVEAGGCCRRCGFAEHPAALQFHHVDPTTKAFNLSSQGVTRSLAKARAEARKCVLLCANCHALVEAGVVRV